MLNLLVMEHILTELFYSDDREMLLKSSTEMMVKISEALLGREPNKSDDGRIETRTNSDDLSINDIYLDNRKVGSLTTNFIAGNKTLGIRLEFIPL
jgi:hypothetical protein